MQAFSLLALLASALGAASSPALVPRDDAAATSGSPSDQLARFDSFPDASCSMSSRRGVSRVLRGEQNACRSFSAELALGAKAIRIVPTYDEDADDGAWAVDVYTSPFCMGDPVTVSIDGACRPAPGPGIHWMSYSLRLQ